jgi:hypothetical protein
MYAIASCIVQLEATSCCHVGLVNRFTFLEGDIRCVQNYSLALPSRAACF